MIRFRLQADDVGMVAIASMPVMDAVLSLRCWARPERFPEHAGLRSMANAFAGLDTALLTAIAPCPIPDFLLPRPDGEGETFESGLDKIRAMPPDFVAASVRQAFGPGPLVPAIADADRDPAGLRDRVADALEEYWRSCLAAHWPAMRAVLEADAAHRGGTATSLGVAAMIEGLHPTLSWGDGGIIAVDSPYPCFHTEVAGRGLRMVPSIFLTRPVTYDEEAVPPVLMYPARGRGTVWSPRPPASSAVRELLGEVRAAMLIRLTVPATTTELARETGTAAPTVNRNLAALHRSGLLRKFRRGREVYYARTPIGDQFVALSDAPCVVRAVST